MSPSLEKLGQMSPSNVFETFLVPAIFAPWAEGLLDSAQIQPGNRILDVACGTGIVARTALRRMNGNGRVSGMDFNAGQLEVAQTLEPAIEWREGNATELPFADGEFDIVTFQQGLQFFPDRQAAIREMRRVLVPGGRLALSVWCSIETCPGYAALHESLARHVGEQATIPFESIFSFPDSQMLRQLIENSGFSSSVVVAEVKMANFASADDYVAIILRGSNLARSGVMIDDQTVEGIQSEVSDKLDQYGGTGGIALPMQANVGTAIK